MTKPQSASAGASTVPNPAQPANSWKNPSYPQRVHLHERAHWQEVLHSCEERVAEARKALEAIAPGPGRAAIERLYIQVQGARDQVAAAASRLPTETGDLYEEDRHRLEEAVAALDRVWKRWKAPE